MPILTRMIIIFSETGKTPRLLAKYRPPAPVLVVTSNEYLARHCSCLYAMHVSTCKLSLKVPVRYACENTCIETGSIYT
eukprot:scaffold31458_cov42-Tisochrysis_lutea.AAC.3